MFLNNTPNESSITSHITLNMMMMMLTITLMLIFINLFFGTPTKIERKLAYTHARLYKEEVGVEPMTSPIITQLLTGGTI